MSAVFRVACAQTCASADEAASVDEAESRVREARERGAALVCLPEYFACLSVQGGRMEVGARDEAAHPVLERFRALAAETGCWLLLGSLAIRQHAGKLRNRSFLIDAGGHVVARYDKIHLFDVDLPGGESYRESESIEPGTQAVVTATPWGPIGLSVCYDLRFAHLYRALAQAGALFLTVPSAFTRTTGQAHWHVLLRARAIETGSYVFAPSQYGSHGEAATFGHSLVVDPWGEVLDDAGEGPGLAVADVDPEAVHAARARIPSLRHDRRFASPEPAAAENPAAWQGAADD